MVDSKIFAMHRRFGTCGALRCKDCHHLISYEFHKSRYYKCRLYGTSCSGATDWRPTYQACGMYSVEQDIKKWVPIIRQLDKSCEKPIDGQVRMEV